MNDLFTSPELYQVFNYYRHPDKARGEKVLRTFGDKKHCENYVARFGDFLDIEPYNADEWNDAKTNECAIIPLEQFYDEELCSKCFYHQESPKGYRCTRCEKGSKFTETQQPYFS